jgi:two-component system, LytTR family, response regulator LytT
MRLYEIEDKLGSFGFVRAGKSSVINLKEVESLKSDFGGRLIATLQNAEKIVISRAKYKIFN